jgi:hypothetical protein
MELILTFYIGGPSIPTVWLRTGGIKDALCVVFTFLMVENISSQSIQKIILS